MQQKGPRIADTCASCGLKIGQVGSVTQWIFRDDRCACESSPTAPVVDVAAAGRAIELKQTDEDLVEQQLLGTFIDDRYRVDAVIGVGGWGCVVQAWHPELECSVAIKLLHPHLSFDSEKVARFKQEAQAARKLRHPNIVPVQDYGHWDGRPYLVMDFLHGHSLSKEITPAGISKERFFEIFEQALAGLSAAHEAGIIHRDLTPSNIFIVEDDVPENSKVKILDFGLAKLTSPAGESIASLTQTGVTLGTPAYMSPEHCMGKQTDARSDVYSLGCCMYEALSGRKLFAEDTVYGLMNAHVSSPPRPLRLDKTSDALPLKDLIERCLEKDPANRPQSAQQVLDALYNLYAGKKLGLGRRRKSALPGRQRSVVVNVATLAAVIATTGVLGMAFSVPITKNLSSELPKIQDKLVLMLPLKREWKRFDVRGTQLMNDGHYKEADEQFVVAESTAQADGNREQQLRSLQQRALIALILNDKDGYDVLLRQIEQLKEKAGDLAQRQVSEAEVAKQALSFVGDHPTAEQIPHLQKLIGSMTNAAVVLQQRGEYKQVIALLEPALVKAKSALGDKDPTYAECLLRISYSRLRDAYDKRYELAEQERTGMISALQSAADTLRNSNKALAQEADLVRAEALMPADAQQALKLAEAVASLPDSEINQRMRLKADLVKALCLAKLSRVSEATQQLQQLIDPLSKLAPEDLPACMREYRLLRYTGTSFDRAAMVKEAEALESTQPLVALNLYLVVLSKMAEDPKLALELSERVLLLAQSETGPISSITATALDYCARSFCVAKRQTECEPMVQQLLAVRRLCGEDEQTIEDTRTWLAYIQMLKGDTASAKKQFDRLAENYRSAPLDKMWELSEFVPNLTSKFATPAERTMMLQRLRQRIDALAERDPPVKTAGRLKLYGRLQFELRLREDALKTFQEAAALLEKRTELTRKDMIQLQQVLKDLVFYQRASGHVAEADKNKALLNEVAAGTFKRGDHW